MVYQNYYKYSRRYKLNNQCTIAIQFATQANRSSNAKNCQRREQVLQQIHNFPNIAQCTEKAGNNYEKREHYKSNNKIKYDCNYIDQFTGIFHIRFDKNKGRTPCQECDYNRWQYNFAFRKYKMRKS